jgi:hypothetical protein
MRIKPFVSKKPLDQITFIVIQVLLKGCWNRNLLFPLGLLIDSFNHVNHREEMPLAGDLGLTTCG